MAHGSIKKNLNNQENNSIRKSLLFYIHSSIYHRKLFPHNRRNSIEYRIKNLTLNKHLVIYDIRAIADEIYYDKLDFEWIVDSLRQRLFIENYVRTAVINSEPRVTVLTLSPLQGYSDRDKCIGFVDYFSIFLPRLTNINIDLNINLKEEWRNFSKVDSIFDWLNLKNSDEARDYFWEYLKRKHSTLLGIKPKFQNHEDVLQFFDNAAIEDVQKIEINGKVKKLWNQNMRRKNNTETKQFNIDLPISTANAIEKLAKKYEFSHTDIIRIVMDSEALNDYHLKNKSNYTKNMLASQNLDNLPKEQLSSKPEEDIKSPPLPDL